MARKRNPREKFLLIFTIIVIVGAGGYEFIYVRITDQYNLLHEQVQDARKQTEKSLATYQDLERIKEEYERRRDGLRLTGNEQEQVIEIKRQIDELFISTDTAYTAHRFLQVRPLEHFKVFSFQFTGISCQIKDLARLLGAIQSSDATLEVSQLLIERRGRGSVRWPAEHVVAELTVSRMVEDPDARRTSTTRTRGRTTTQRARRY